MDDVVHQLHQCRNNSYATNCEELFRGDMGLAAPVCNARGQVVGAVHVAPPTSRWSMADAERRLPPWWSTVRVPSRLVAPG